jgi:HSP20 family protein
MALVRFTRRQPRINFPGLTGAPTFPTFDDVENRMSRFIERAFNEPFAGGLVPEPMGWVPAMDIVETANELTLTAELPGIDQKDVDVSIEGGLLTIRGEKTEERKEGEGENDKKVYLYERTYGSFQRSFALPPMIDVSNITAAFEKGVLKVHMPKTAEVKPKGRKIDIKTT